MTAELPVVLPDLCPLSPPCLICHGKGSGMHYGVNTCNACKGFFQRCITRNNGTNLKCKYKGACRIEHGEANNACRRFCASCRFKKCLQLGMVKNGSRPGRYTAEQRTRVIEEVKRLEIQTKFNGNGLVKPTKHEKQMDDLVKLLTETRLDAVPNTSKRLEIDLDCEKKFLESLRVEENLYGQRNPLNRSESKKIYADTGLDVDGRRDVVKKLLKYVNEGMRDMFTFANQIPGFEQLSQRDKKKLLKYSSSEVVLFQCSHCYNLTDNILVHSYDPELVFRIEDVMIFASDDIPRDDLVKGFLHKLQIIQDLELTIEETTIASALCLMIPGVSLSPFSRNIVYNITDYLVEILQHEISKNHDPEEHTLSKIILLLYDIRIYDRYRDEANANFIQDAIEVGMEEPIACIFEGIDR